MKILRILLENGADPNAIIHEGDALLHIAVRLKHVNSWLILKDFGADPDLENLQGITPRMLAQQAHMEKDFQSVFDAGAETDADAVTGTFHF